VSDFTYLTITKSKLYEEKSTYLSTLEEVS
jgi:hypothetical protein